MVNINDALKALNVRGHRIGKSYIDAGGTHFVVVDDVAMRYPHAFALAEGRTTLQEVLADIERAARASET